MTTKDFDKLGDECIDHLTALNPKGGIKLFIRMAVEFGYQRAVEKLSKANEVKTSTESVEVCEICNGSGVMKFNDFDNGQSLCICKQT